MLFSEIFYPLRSDAAWEKFCSEVLHTSASHLNVTVQVTG